MTHAPTPILRATTAICAVLALGSTPAWAQEVAPTIDVPAASAPAAAQPTIVLPNTAPAPAAPVAAPPVMTSQPMVQQTPVVTPPPAAITAEETAPTRAAAERPAPRTAARTTPRASAAPAQAAAAPAAEPVPAAPVTADAPMSPAASVPLTQPATTPPPADTSLQNGPQEGAQALEDNSATAMVGAGAALLLALGLGTFAVTRRRRRHVEVHEDTALAAPATVYAEPAPRPVVTAPVVEPTIAPQPVAAQSVAAMPLDPRRSIGEEELVPATHPAAAKPAASLDGPVPQTRAERDALLDRMISAEPDASNPFTSRKARLRRARIILQSREIDEKNAATTPFDWRAYKSSTSNPAPATPPRVTA
ncbi:hypothetical protein OLX23_20635 [Novosphingobium sp. JCM 18896]|nr:hypothetical protein [Novosphingobium sp. JCM 18896]